MNMIDVSNLITYDWVDVTPMVIMTLLVLVCLLVAFLMFALYGEKKDNPRGVFVVIACALITAAIIMQFITIKTSIDAGIAWERNRCPYTAESITK